MNGAAVFVFAFPLLQRDDWRENTKTHHGVAEKTQSGKEKAGLRMFRPSGITLIAITLVSLMLALVLLPGIAGLIEGDFRYIRWELRRGWNNDNNISFADALADVYSWSFWRIGLRAHEPQSYSTYQMIEAIRVWGL
jgi:hypothetical protein